jgi:hypothetical protein
MGNLVLQQLQRLEKFVNEQLTIERNAHEAFETIFDGYVPPLKTSDWDNIIQICSDSIDQIFYHIYNGDKSVNINLGNIEYFVYEVLLSDKFVGAITFKDTKYEFRTAEEFYPALVAINENYYAENGRKYSNESNESNENLIKELKEIKEKYAELHHRYSQIDNHYQEMLKDKDSFELTPEIEKAFEMVTNGIINLSDKSKDHMEGLRTLLSLSKISDLFYKKQ